MIADFVEFMVGVINVPLLAEEYKFRIVISILFKNHYVSYIYVSCNKSHSSEIVTRVSSSPQQMAVKRGLWSYVLAYRLH